MKKFIAFVFFTLVVSCSDNSVMQPFDKSQKPADITVRGYSKPDVLQLRLNGTPVSIEGNTSYTDRIETKLEFVLDEGETDRLGIYNHETGTEIAHYNITYDNVGDYKTLNFFNLPGIFLQASAVKPQVNLGKVGFEFIFPNLGEYSGTTLSGVKGILRRENGIVLAEFDHIEKKSFTAVKIYNYFSNTAPVYLELYKPDSTTPYTGSEIIKVKIKQDMGANLIVLQEKLENGVFTVKGDIDVADYL
ncbi:hypothetical protein ACKW6Q_17760 [Chryseobacterium kwangjuense]|uniref:Uncharacterized protein n=1 Tax=Chryseobacterium kwangjuense TaxID=267125 RepID=A0ABW9K666_9FLAO